MRFPIVDPVMILAYKRYGETYVVVYKDTVEQKGMAVSELAKMAKNPELAFSWNDFSILHKKVREYV